MNVFSHLYWQLLPGICICCRQDSQRQIDICVHCERALPYLKNANPCPSCALPQDTDVGLCAACVSQPKLWNSMTATFRYEGLVSRWIQLNKYHSALVEPRVLATLMARDLKDAFPNLDLIVPVPLSWQRLWQRGHNQSYGLARKIGRQLNVPVHHQALKRIRHTPPQQQLSRVRRMKNLHNAFQASAQVAGKSVALIDDVITTQTTVTEATAALLKSGASEVHVWAAARVLR